MNLAHAISAHIDDFSHLRGALWSGQSGQDPCAHARARLLLAVGRVDALHLARSQDAFEAALDALADRRFLVELERAFADPEMDELLRRARVGNLSAPPPTDPVAEELHEDLRERWEALLKLRPETEAVDDRQSQEALARVVVCGIGLLLASEGGDEWKPWMRGLLWTEGKRALLELAAAGGIAPDVAAAALTTSREGTLEASPFSRSASDAALRLLGLAH